MSLNFSSTVRNLAVAAVGFLVIAGCSQGVRQHIRQYDFREMNRAETKRMAAPSPIADVFDMPGWSSDLEGAVTFAGTNGYKTAVFVYREDNAATAKAKTSLNAISGRFGTTQRVAVDANRNPGVISRLGLQRMPALVVLDPAGSVIARESGGLNKSQVVTLIQ